MTQSAEPLNVTIDDSLSIDQLVQLQAEGFSVLRSAHVGNFSPYNLTLADAGIPILCVDHNITGVDTNYFPEDISGQSGTQRIALLSRLACRAAVRSVPPEVAQLSNGARYIDETHILATRAVIPGSRIITNTAYLRDNEAIVGEMVQTAVKEFPQLFQRIALPDGSTQRTNRGAEVIGRFGVMQLNDDPRAENEAVIMPNEIDILANFVIEALISGRATQYHLSGPAMVKYIAGELPKLKAIYQKMRDTTSFGSRLPSSLSVQLVPTAQAKFATTTARQPQLEALIMAITELENQTAADSKRRREFFTADKPIDPVEKKKLAEEHRDGSKALVGVIAERAAALPELFIEPGKGLDTAGFITQYDVLREGGLYVPALNRSRSMSELSQLSSMLNRARKKSRA